LEGAGLAYLIFLLEDFAALGLAARLDVFLRHRFVLYHPLEDCVELVGIHHQGLRLFIRGHGCTITNAETVRGTPKGNPASALSVTGQTLAWGSN
jgi:hypothetical protein